MIFNIGLHPKTKALLQYGFCSVLLLLLLAACSTPAATTESIPATIEIIPPTQTEIEPKSTPHPTFTTEPDEVSVTSQPSDKSRIEINQITSQALENNLIGDPSTRGFYVYLPPGYDTTDNHYPVVYALHGFMVGAEENYPMGKKLDELIESGEAQEMILVFVDGNNKFEGSWYLSSPTIGDYETYIASDLVEYIDATYRTIPDRNSRGITGCSMGGDGSLHLAFNYPDVFSVAVPRSGFYNYENHPLWEQAIGNKFTPEDFNDLNRLSWELRYLMAGAAAVSSNPDNPPFYLDMPFEVVD
ncbi:hypothetical protein KA005_51015, partial [bacterium]|nr:hypothetical protein [bacterium]